MWVLLVFALSGMHVGIVYDTYEECIGVAHKLTLMEAYTTKPYADKEPRRLVCLEIRWPKGKE